MARKPKPTLPQPGSTRLVKLADGTVVRVRYINSKQRKNRAAQRR
jgi:hypothetical protein